MFKLNFTQSFFQFTSTLGLIAIGNCLIINSADAFSINGGSGITNGGFEQSIDGTNPTNGWSTTGDVTTIIENRVSAAGTAVNPVSGSRQAILTNAYDTSKDMNRADDVERLTETGPTAPLNFNQSGTNPVDADTVEPTTGDLQSFLGLETNSLSIPRENPANPGDPRTSKEGSGMTQTFTVEITTTDVANKTNGFEISFNWAYLTNDGTLDGSDGTFPGGDQDYSFFTLYEENDAIGDRDLTVLADSSGSISDPTAENDYISGNTEFYTSENLYTQTVTGLGVGTYNYTIGFGVVDIDGSGRSSALLLDNYGIRQVPFEFSPSAGIGIVFGFLGLNRLRRRMTK